MGRKLLTIEIRRFPPEEGSGQDVEGFTDYPILADDTLNDPWSNCIPGKLYASLPMSVGTLKSRYTDADGNPKFWGVIPACRCQPQALVGIELDLGTIEWSYQEGDSTLHEVSYTRFPYRSIACNSESWTAGWYRKYIAFWAWDFRGVLNFYVIFGTSGVAGVGGVAIGPRMIQGSSFESTVSNGGIAAEGGGSWDRAAGVPAFNPAQPTGTWVSGELTILTFTPENRAWQGEFSAIALAEGLTTPEGLLRSGIAPP